MNYLIYDLEIMNAIPHNGRRQPNITYCEGWHDHINMGISTLCAYESWSQRFRVFCDDNKEEFRDATITADIIVGFNNIAFDNDVVLKNWQIYIPAEKSFDILTELWAASGLPRTYQGHLHQGFGLDATCLANLGLYKTGHGANAPIHFQRGEFGTLIDYCLEDVRLTKALFDRIQSDQCLFCPKTGNRLTIFPPFSTPAAIGA